MSVEWIEYQEKKILYSNYTGLNEDEMFTQLKEETRIIMEHDEKEQILYFANFENTIISPEFMKEGNENGKKTRHKIAKSAITGVFGMRASLLNSFNKFTMINARAFKNENDAKEYLVS